MTKAEVGLFDTILEWSKELGVDHTEFFTPEGFHFFDWWEKLVSCMTLEEVEVYLSIPEPQGEKVGLIYKKLTKTAIAHRDRLVLAVEEGAVLNAKAEQCAG
ncbi:hypothetical protein [Brevibacillus panacihumi]|uniref:Uncharacterized protein n=1 Tax=Brevibacillus panacihumi TaxID=497735 RepID=A0A3M8C8V9_9BACL|nr:hypothetical protein [Brevibacillus panacihumi]RNB72150.1 hypothetical protein EDM58_21845 [Brevibacillus panacihumi]